MFPLSTQRFLLDRVHTHFWEMPSALLSSQLVEAERWMTPIGIYVLIKISCRAELKWIANTPLAQIIANEWEIQLSKVFACLVHCQTRWVTDLCECVWAGLHDRSVSSHGIVPFGCNLGFVVTEKTSYPMTLLAYPAPSLCYPAAGQG